MTNNTNDNYEANVDINHLSRIANADYVGARILWNLGLFYPSLHLLHESFEKYLKVLWAKNRTFKNKKELDWQLKCFGHNYKAILNALEPKDKNRLLSVARKDGLKLYDLIGLRYGLPTVIWNDILFRGVENVLKEIKNILKEPQKKNLFEMLLSAFPHENFGKSNKKKQILKQILSLPRTSATKKQRKAHQKKFRIYMDKLIKKDAE